MAVNETGHRKYRTAIDGLRAIAVLSVLVYHFRECLLPGGFVGVDVFFVISGYLITGNIRSSLDSGTFSVSEFFVRRISRIAPMAFLVTAVTLAVSSVIYGPEDLGAIAAAGMASAVSLANVKFLMQGSYFEFFPDTQPFLHFWSLSVEEQFYFVFPFLLLAGFSRSETGGRALLICSLIALCSLLACIIVTWSHPAVTFYLIPFRAWELLAGGLLALVVGQSSAPSWQKRSFVQPVGLALILLSVLLIPDGDKFPGWYGIFPVLGTVMAIGGHTKWVEMLLSNSLLSAIGKRSYSLYLWHWPIFCFVDYAALLSSESVRSFIKIILPCLAAEISYRYFEAPFRDFLNRRVPRLLTVTGFAVMVASTVAVAGWMRSENFNNINTSSDKVAAGGEAFWFSDAGPRIVLAGDSNAGMYGKIMVELAEESGWRLNVLCQHSSDPFPGSRLWEETQKWVAAARPDVIVFVASWGPKQQRFQQISDSLFDNFNRGIPRVVVIQQPPLLPDGVTRAKIRQTGYQAFREVASDSNPRYAVNRQLEFLSTNAIVVPTDDLFLNSDKTIRFFDDEGCQLFRDRTHLSYAGAKLVKPRLHEAIHFALTGSKESKLLMPGQSQ